MPDFIRDGKGRGYLAEVNNDNRLVTKSIVVTNLSDTSRLDQKSFFARFTHTQQIGDTLETMGYFEYTGDDFIRINRLTFCTDEAGDTNTARTALQVLLKNTSTSGGSLVELQNLNRTSQKTIDYISLDTNDGSSAITTTDGITMFCIRLSGPSTWEEDFRDGLILGNGDNIAFKVKATSAGTKARIVLYLYEEKETS